MNLTTDIIKLLKEYSSSLLLNSGGILKGLIETRIIDNKIIYDFKINYRDNVSCKIFEIMILDLNGNISLSIYYFKESETFYIKEHELGNKIDEIISSEKMGNFIKFLIDK